MILHHYTTKSYVSSIAKYGLTQGEMLTSPKHHLRYVWLTSDIDPSGHGLSGGEKISPEHLVKMGISPDCDMSWPNKREVRFSLKISTSNRRLKSWRKCGRRMVGHYFDQLNAHGGGKSKTWYLYRGIIPSSWLNLTDLTTGEEIPDWQSVYANEPLLRGYMLQPIGQDFPNLNLAA